MSSTRLALNALLAATLMPLLGGCFTTIAMNGLNGAGACPPGAMQRAMAFMRTVDGLPEPAIRRTPVTDVVLQAGSPNRREELTLNTRAGQTRTVEKWSWRTGHPRCRHMPTDAGYSSLIVAADGSNPGYPTGTILAFQPGTVAAWTRQAKTTRLLPNPDGPAAADAGDDPLTTTDILLGRF